MTGFDFRNSLIKDLFNIFKKDGYQSIDKKLARKHIMEEIGFLNGENFGLRIREFIDGKRAVSVGRGQNPDNKKENRDEELLGKRKNRATEDTDKKLQEMAQMGQVVSSFFKYFDEAPPVEPTPQAQPQQNLSTHQVVSLPAKKSAEDISPSITISTHPVPQPILFSATDSTVIGLFDFIEETETKRETLKVLEKIKGRTNLFVSPLESSINGTQLSSTNSLGNFI